MVVSLPTISGVHIGDVWDLPIRLPVRRSRRRHAVRTGPGQRVLHARQLDDRGERVIELVMEEATFPEKLRVEELWINSQGIIPIGFIDRDTNCLVFTEDLVKGTALNQSAWGWVVTNGAAEATAATPPAGVPGGASVWQLRGAENAAWAPNISQACGLFPAGGTKINLSAWFKEETSKYERLNIRERNSGQSHIGDFRWNGGVLETFGTPHAALTLHEVVSGGGGWYEGRITLDPIASPIPLGSSFLSKGVIEGWVYSAVWDNEGVGIYPALNLLTAPHDFTDAAWVSSVTVTADDATGPFFANQADKLDDTSGGATQITRQDISSSVLSPTYDGVDLQCSVFLKKPSPITSTSKVIIRHQGAAPAVDTQGTVDWSLETISLISNGGGIHTATLEKLSDTIPAGPLVADWFRVDLGLTYDDDLAGGPHDLRMEIQPASGAAADTQAIWAWGARLDPPDDNASGFANPYAWRGSHVWGTNLTFGDAPVAHQPVAGQKINPIPVTLDGDDVEIRQVSGQHYRIAVRLREVIG